MLRVSLGGVSDPEKINIAENEREALYQNALGILPDASVYSNKSRDYTCSPKHRKQVDHANFCKMFMIMSLVFTVAVPDLSAFGALALFSLIFSAGVIYGYSFATAFLPRKKAALAVAIVVVPIISMFTPTVFKLYEEESLATISIIIGALVYMGFAVYLYKRDANEIEKIFQKK